MRTPVGKPIPNLGRLRLGHGVEPVLQTPHSPQEKRQGRLAEVLSEARNLGVPVAGWVRQVRPDMPIEEINILGMEIRQAITRKEREL